MPPRSDSTPSQAGAWERHGQTLIAALILAAIIWVGKSVTDLTGTMGVVVNRLDNLEAKLTSMDQRFDKYQTKSQAQAEKENQLLRESMIDARLKSLEKRAGE